MNTTAIDPYISFEFLIGGHWVLSTPGPNLSFFILPIEYYLHVTFDTIYYIYQSLLIIHRSRYYTTNGYLSTTDTTNCGLWHTEYCGQFRRDQCTR